MRKKFKVTLVVFLVVVLGCFSQVFAASNPNTKLKKSIEARKSVKLLDGTSDSGVDKYTKLLMHMDDNNFKDECGHTFTNNKVLLDTTNKKIGNGSASFNGSDSYLNISNTTGLNLSNDNFTIDWWEYRTNINTNDGGVLQLGNGNGISGILLGFNNNLVYMSSDNINWDIAAGKTLGTAVLNSWQHLAVVRSGNMFYTFRNGVKQDSWENSSSISLPSMLNIGMYYNGKNNYFQGNIDELRISEGIARWVPINKINLNKVTDILTLNDETKGTDTLTAEVTPDNVTNKTVKWTSSDPSIVTVDENGNIKAIKAGTATITATTTDGSNLSKSCVVTVTEPTIITLDKTTYSINVGDTGKITASVTPAEQAVAWSSSDNSIATVDGNGNIKGVSAGTAVITATTADGKTVSCTVTVKDKETGKSKLTLYMNDKTIREFYLTQDEIDDFIDWYTSKVKGEVTVQPYYVFNVSVPGKSSTKKSYVWFMKIESFELE